MKVLFFLLLLCLLSIPCIATAADPSDNYCDNEASWQQWNRLLTDNPSNDGIASLYAFRIGLCSMVKSGQIETARATKLFESLRDTVLQSIQEARRQAIGEKGYSL